MLELLLNHRVEYPARLLGQTEVSSPKGTHVVRDAIHTIKFQTEVRVRLKRPHQF